MIDTKTQRGAPPTRLGGKVEYKPAMASIPMNGGQSGSFSRVTGGFESV